MLRELLGIINSMINVRKYVCTPLVKAIIQASITKTMHAELLITENNGMGSNQSDYFNAINCYLCSVAK
jgi:hypothetical protein